VINRVPIFNFLSQVACKRLLGILLGVAFIGCVGCSKDSTTAEVSGSVTVDGEPAKIGSIGVFPVDGNSPTAGGAIKDGQYMTKVPLGEAKVEIRVSKVVGQKKLYDTPDSPMQDIMVEILPDKFNNESELRIDVQPGTNKQDYDLPTKN
jgi:hypothetical protein